MAQRPPEYSGGSNGRKGALSFQWRGSVRCHPLQGGCHPFGSLKAGILAKPGPTDGHECHGMNDLCRGLGNLLCAVLYTFLDLSQFLSPAGRFSSAEIAS